MIVIAGATMARGDGKQKHADGRALADFLDGRGRLRLAEQQLLEACEIGGVADLGDERPAKASGSNTIRGEFVRFLALGGDGQAPVHEQGVLIQGAWIEGEINLEACSVTRPLWLTACHIEGELMLSDASIMCLDLDGTHVKEIDAPRLRCHGDLTLSNGFRAEIEVSLIGARIGGGFDCEGGIFEGKNEKGEVEFSIACDGAEFSSDVFLSEGFTASGEVRLIGARISGDLYLMRGKFSCAGEREGSDRKENAITLRRARIGGALYFREISKLSGEVSLADARIVTINDDLASWRKASGINLDGLQYERIDDDASVATSMRIEWLGKQSRNLDTDFKPQPWEQLIKVMRAMGYADEARVIAIEKQKQLRRSGKIKGFAATLHDIYGFLYGYGYQPLRLAVNAAVMASMFAVVFWLAECGGIMVPTDRQILAKAQELCSTPAPKNWATCDKLKREYTVFNPLIYSLDLILPLAGLRQSKDWAPSVVEPCEATVAGFCVQEKSGQPMALSPFGVTVAVLASLEYLFGWLAGLMFVAVASGLIKKD